MTTTRVDSDRGSIIVYSSVKQQQVDATLACDRHSESRYISHGVAWHNKALKQRPRAYSMLNRKEEDEGSEKDISRIRRKSLPATDFNLIASFLSVPKSEMSDTSGMLGIGESDDKLRRARSLRERGDRRGDHLRRVRSFKTTSKGLVNRGDSFKKNRTISQPGSANNFGANAPEKVETVQIVTPENHDEPVTNHFRVMVLGAPGVGKSSVIDQFMTSEFLGFGNFNISQSEDERTVTLQVDGDESTMEFLQSEDLDQEGMECFPIDGYILTYSITDKSSFHLTVEILKQLRDEVGPGKAIILAANKSDLVRKRTISNEEGRNTADDYGCKYIEISAALNHKVDELLVGMLKQILLKVKAVSLEEQGDDLISDNKKRKSSFKKTKLFLEKLFRGNSGKDKHTENLYVD